MAALLHVAEELQVVETINRHVPETSQEIRDGLTVGGSLLRAAVGRACQPPCHQKKLIAATNPSLRKLPIAGKEVACYRTRTWRWELDLTVVVYLSETLLEGQLREITQYIKKLVGMLVALQKKIRLPASRGRKRTKQALEETVRGLILSHDLERLIG